MMPPTMTGNVTFEHPQSLIPKLCLKQPYSSLLDVGGGGGTVGNPYWEVNHVMVTTIDAWPPATKPAVFVQMLAQDALAKFGPKSFDCVMACEMIEHCEKPVGQQLLKDFVEIARKFVILTCPNGFSFQDPAAAPHEPWAGNPFQKHVCGWTPEEFLAAGYSVFMNGGDPARHWAAGQIVAFREVLGGTR